MEIIKYGKIVLLVLLCTQFSMAARLTVSKDGRGTFKSVQAAIDAAGPGDEVEILDVAVYEEQVTIDSTKGGLVLKSTSPKALTKPTIKWKDVVHVLPKTGNQAKFEDSINFDQNGALRLMNVRGVIVDGIKVDGGGRAPFGYSGIWNMKDPLFHGNAALDLWRSGDAVIRNCELTNAYFGINIKDRNLGGVYANINPADLDKNNNVPLSGFGKTGNHLFEYNRIHANSWGMFFESTWDLGSVIRYNLIYENYHDPETYAAQVKAMPDGGNQPGGALLFKDMLLSPLAVYNNTFWHNYVVFGSHWRAGAQHLVFNNIVAEPYQYWAINKSFPNPYIAMDPKLINRMHHCLYACQEKAPGKRSQKYNGGFNDPATNTYVSAESTITANDDQIRIMNGITKPTVEGLIFNLVVHLSTGDSLIPTKVDWATLPGAVMKDFAVGANVRWYEIKFKSTDPKSPDFLTPDWDDPLVKSLVLDAGWPDAGVRDADGSIADLGAIPRDGVPATEVLIKPTQPVMITGTSATATFNAYGLDKGSLKNMKIKYIRWLKDVPYDTMNFGGDIKTPIPASSIVTVQLPATELKMGGNSFTFQIPQRLASETYAFFELIAEGEDSKGNLVATSVGFLPYRKLDYTFTVEIVDALSRPKTTVRAGEQVTIIITPRKVGNKTEVLSALVKPVDVSLGSGNILTDVKTNTGLAFPSGITKSASETVFFTKAGTEVVSVSGVINLGDKIPIMGASDPITVLPGPPEKIAFSSPKSKSFEIVDPGTTFKVKVQVLDKYDNKVDAPTEVKVKSTLPNLIDILTTAGGFSAGADVSAMTDSTGLAIFGSQVTAKNLNDDTVPIVATLAVNSATDNAKLVVGKPRAKFWILYSDTITFDPSVELRGCAGLRFPVTLKASMDGKTVLTDINAAFSVETSPGLVVYATEDDTVPLTKSALKSGKLTIWVKAKTGNVSNGVITINSEDNTVLSSSRSDIYFTSCGPEIERAAYFSNGLGQVNRMEIYYRKDLASNEVPDSFMLYWPTISAENSRLVKGAANIKVDPADPKHLSVTIPEPFGANNTFTSVKNLGTSYWSNKLTPDEPPMVKPFNITDSVGPLLMTATIVERIAQTGDDTLFITFSEQVNYKLLEGTSLTLLKNGTTVNLTVSSSTPFGGDTLRVIIPNGGDKSPKYGDSLKILATGPVRDLYGNAAHADNRPVKIGIKLIPPSIVSASYTDGNGNGIVDFVTIKFDKQIVQGIVKIICTWPDLPSSTDTLKGTDIVYDANDNTVIRVNIEGKFGNSNSRVLDKTSGNMDVVAIFTDFGGITKPGKAEDKAAPVIKSATYFPGEIDTTTGNPLPDILKVTFSEYTENISNSNKPFVLYHNGAPTASLTLGPAVAAEQCEYEVITADYFPLNGDSINIKADTILADRGRTAQVVPTNKKVPIKVESVSPTLKFTIGPNPFTPGLEELSIKIKPLSKMVENVNVKSKLIIQDQLGNKVWTKELQTDKSLATGVIEFKWNGHNRFGRLVSPGTYLATVITEDLVTGEKLAPREFAVGVKK